MRNIETRQCYLSENKTSARGLWGGLGAGGEQKIRMNSSNIADLITNVAQFTRFYSAHTVYTMHSRFVIEGKLVVEVQCKDFCTIRQCCGCLWDYCVWAEWKIVKVVYKRLVGW